MRVVNIKLKGGGNYIQPLNTIQDAIDGELCDLQVGESITLSFTMLEMSEKEYEELPEFMGH